MSDKAKLAVLLFKTCLADASTTGGLISLYKWLNPSTEQDMALIKIHSELIAQNQMQIVNIANLIAQYKQQESIIKSQEAAILSQRTTINTLIAQNQELMTKIIDLLNEAGVNKIQKKEHLEAPFEEGLG